VQNQLSQIGFEMLKYITQKQAEDEDSLHKIMSPIFNHFEEIDWQCVKFSEYTFYSIILK